MKHDNAFVPVLGSEVLATASLHVRSDAMTLFFFPTPWRGTRAACSATTTTGVLPDGRVHLLYAIKLPSRTARPGAHARLLAEFLPRTRRDSPTK